MSKKDQRLHMTLASKNLAQMTPLIMDEAESLMKLIWPDRFLLTRLIGSGEVLLAPRDTFYARAEAWVLKQPPTPPALRRINDAPWPWE